MNKLVDKRVIVQANRNAIKITKSCFVNENCHNELFANKKFNKFINKQLKKEFNILNKNNSKNLLK